MKAKGIKTALKCNDFRKFEKNIILDEEEVKSRVTLGEKQRAVFKDIVRKDADFFAAARIIDYSLLLGEVVENDMDDLRDQIRANPELGSGVYFDVEGRAWVIGIIDPLTGFNFKKNLEYRGKRLRHGTEMSCVPPPLYAERFKDFMEEAIQSNVDAMEFEHTRFSNRL